MGRSRRLRASFHRNSTNKHRRMTGDNRNNVKGRTARTGVTSTGIPRDTAKLVPRTIITATTATTAAHPATAAPAPAPVAAATASATTTATAATAVAESFDCYCHC